MYKYLPNKIGYSHYVLNKSMFPVLNQEIDKMKNNNFINTISINEELAGNIEKEFRLIECIDELSNIIIPLCVEYSKESNYIDNINILTKDCPMILYESWINFQKKHEYNPIHKHSGIFSFVLWIQIPYNIEDEMKNLSSINSNSNYPGHFGFHYVDVLGDISTKYIPADKNMEYNLLLFPSRLNHSVNPFFTSDDYRISVSGNFKLKV